MIQRDIASALGISKGECSKRVARGMPLDSVESARAWCARAAARSPEGAGHKSHSASVTDSARALTGHAPPSLRAADSTPPSPTDTTPAVASDPLTTRAPDGGAHATPHSPASRHPDPNPAATPGGAPDPEPRASGAHPTADAAAVAHSSTPAPSHPPSDLRSTLPRLTRPHGALDTAPDTAPDDPAGTLARMRETEQRSYALIDAALAKAARTTAADDYAALPGLIRSYNQAAANSLAAASAWEKHCRAAGEVAPVEHLVNLLDTTLEPLMAQLANLPALVAPKANPAAPAIAEAAIAAELATIRRQIADALDRPIPPAPAGNL